METQLCLRDSPCYKHYLKLITKGKKGYIFKLYTNNRLAIRKIREGRVFAIMPAGGPKLTEGQLLSGYDNYKVLQITYHRGNYYIILEDLNDEEENTTADT